MEGNYNRYRGASDSLLPSDKGKTKDSYCNEISDIIKRAGIKIERTRNAVQAKINDIESSYHRANDWINNTGAGVECQISLQNYVKSLCPYYYDVHETFMDRASSFAEFTNERNFEEDSLGSDVETGTKTDTTDTNDTVNSSRSAATGNPTAVRISPKTTGSRAIDVDFTAKQSNCLSLVSASTATQKML